MSREEYTVLAQAIEESENNLAQLHGLWGIGILARHGIFEIKIKKVLTDYLEQDYSVELKAQVLNLIADLRMIC